MDAWVTEQELAEIEAGRIAREKEKALIKLMEGEQTNKKRNMNISILYEVGVSVKHLAETNNLSEGTIRNIVFGSGASRHDVTTKRHDEILAMVDAGFKKTDVAKKFGMKPSAISNIVARRAWKLDTGT